MKHSESKAHPKDGKRLKIIRRLNGETQAEFASNIGVCEGTVRNNENGHAEMSLNTSRQVFKSYNLNPTPANPDEDPRLLLHQVSTTPLEDNMETPRSFYEHVIQFRKKVRVFQNEICSPFRRFVETAINVVLFIAAIVFGVEQLLRALPYVDQDPGFARDVIFVGALLLIIILFVPAMLSIPWGMKIEQESET